MGGGNRPVAANVQNGTFDAVRVRPAEFPLNSTMIRPRLGGALVGSVGRRFPNTVFSRSAGYRATIIVEQVFDIWENAR